MATKIYTKTGDDGTTGLFGGQRVSKFSTRIEAYGTVDELNSVIGLALSAKDMPRRMREPLLRISSMLFTAGADLATPIEHLSKHPIPRVHERHTLWLEGIIDEYTEDLPALRNFILPIGTQAASFLHLARTVCRRAERSATQLATEENIGEWIVPYLNRLSDYLFTAARMANFLEGVDDVPWKAEE